MTDGQTYIQSESKANILRKSKSENTKNTILPSAWKPSCALVKFLFTADCKHSEAERGQKIQICNQGGVAPILRNVNSKLQTFWGRKRSKDTHLYPPLHCTNVWGITSDERQWLSAGYAWHSRPRTTTLSSNLRNGGDESGWAPLISSPEGPRCTLTSKLPRE